MFRGAGRLAGTICVYPAVGSEIFVRKMSVIGEVDPSIVVTGPVGTLR